MHKNVQLANEDLQIIKEPPRPYEIICSHFALTTQHFPPDHKTNSIQAIMYSVLAAQRLIREQRFEL